MNKIYGLIGGTLVHSFSPQIHKAFGGYEYSLFPMDEDSVASFLQKREFSAINVTIPYKETVMPYLDRISPEAMAVGSVNTVVKEADGTLSGYNTDVYGFEQMIKKGKIEIGGKKALVLGSGGASKTAVYVLKKLGASCVTVISRNGQDNYSNLEKHADAEIIVNTTPVGMYPKNGVSPIELSCFSRLSGAIDVIYNPEKTAFLLQAESLDIPCVGGLYMLVAQAARASELFTKKSYTSSDIDRVYSEIDRTMRNITLVGMPGCGKSTVGRALGNLLDREVVDCDECFTKTYGRTPSDVILGDGEAEFRRLETEVLRTLTARSSLVICSGGGSVTVPENHALIRQNGKVVFINRDISLLATEGRPLSTGGVDKLKNLFDTRLPLYRAVCDIEIQNDANQSVEKIAKNIANELGY